MLGVREILSRKPMSKSTTSRKLEIFALHCHLEKDKTPNYRDFFQRLARAKGKTRQLTFADKLIAIPVMRSQATDTVELIAYEGPLGVSPLMFNATPEKARIATLEASAVVATRTHVIFDLRSREAVVEYNQRGAKAHDIAEVLEAAARTMKLGEQPAVELNPVTDDSFLQAIDRFGVIKLANLRVAEPNVDWTDNYNHLTAVANDSNARTVELSVTAHRNDSLARDHGVMQYIRAMIGDRLSALKGARVVGIRSGEEAQTTVSLANHIQHQKVFVQIDENGHIVSSDILKKMHAFLAARLKRR